MVFNNVGLESKCYKKVKGFTQNYANKLLIHQDKRKDKKSLN